MDLTRQDIDALVKAYRAKPNKDTFFTIKNWYHANQHDYHDGEYMICIYIFLLGANIKQKYIDYTYDQHCDYIREIRGIVENAEPLLRSGRKVYLDYGVKTDHY